MRRETWARSAIASLVTGLLLCVGVALLLGEIGRRTAQSPTTRRLSQHPTTLAEFSEPAGAPSTRWTVLQMHTVGFTLTTAMGMRSQHVSRAANPPPSLDGARSPGFAAIEAYARRTSRAEGDPPLGMQISEAGFPFRCMYSEWIDTYGQSPVLRHGLDRRPGKVGFRAAPDLIAWPLGVRWLGLLANWLIYSTVVFFILSWLWLWRAARRHARCRCVSCGYQLPQPAPCPECGLSAGVAT